MLGLQVDDLIVGGFSDKAIADVKAYLSGTFNINEPGVINGRFSSLDIKLVKDGISISMETYFKYMIGASGLGRCHSESTPMMLNRDKLVVVDPGEQLDDEDA